MKLFILLTALLAVSNAAKCPKNEMFQEHCSCEESLDFTSRRFLLVVRCFNMVHEEFLGTMALLKNLTIDTLYINKAHVKDLTPDIFEGIEIRRLFITGTGIDNVVSGTLASIKNLKRLDLYNTNIKAMPDFTGTTSLEAVYIETHKITTIKETDLKDLVNLRGLGIVDGYLDTIENGAFLPLIKLEKLILNDNYLTTIPDELVAPNSTLKEIQLNNNHLTSIPATALDNADQLEVFEANGNLLRNFPEEPFKRLLRNGVVVDVRSNQFKCDQSLCWFVKFYDQHPYYVYLDGRCFSHPNSTTIIYRNIVSLTNETLNCQTF